jgi:transcription-repair coupling factor (superfamily II helicase)
MLDFTSNRESLNLEFADGSMLYVPLNESHLLTRYVGLSKRSPKLGKIGSNQWERDRKAAEKSTMDLAVELLSLQAKRESVEGFSFPPDDEWMKQFEKAFPYNETPDQLTAIHQCKVDMERTRPMDRLICGDVGFGKTEVAMRAAFKALEAGKQVALLVPTTVLCQQHYHTFRERMAPFPVSVSMISGFRTAAEQKTLIQKIKTGQIDMVIGTHRLLSKDVTFHDLGLIIIDEEHRFGVKQKEKLKLIAETVDALTLSATPIPRTLYMALTGARDLSVIETPPRNRLPIDTVVRSYSNEIVDSAIRAEVDRGGQVFYLHNRVATIEKVADMIRQRNPKVRVVVGHGQMERNELEGIMTRFVDGDYDVMVCTTIIESGLDIPNCNTLIIEGADKFGLAQLYQIRGRVGRFNRQAYAYLLLHRKTVVADVARKRLSAIRQHNELGAGYRIAMRDLELRGAGNILGSAQSGHIAGVGFELYCRLLKQSISRFKTGDPSQLVRAVVNLDFAKMGEPPFNPESMRSTRIKTGYEIIKESEEDKDWIDPIYAHIPQAYIHETRLRIEFYRKLASAASVDEVKSIRGSLKDRFGIIPDETEALIRISAIRCLAEQKNIASVESNRGRLKLRIANKRDIQYVKNGTYFPRLTKKPPLLLLNDCLTFLSKM